MKKQTILSILLILSILFTSHQKIVATNIINSGTYSDTLSWSFDDEGTLTLTGTGEISREFFYSIKDTLKGQLKTIKIGEGFTSLSSDSFSGDEITFETIYIPSTIKKIGQSTFLDCPLQNIYLSNGLECIEMEAFVHCYNLTSISIPDTVTEISYNAFEECFSLKEVKLPNGLQVISEATFLNCDSLKEITLPESLTTIEAEAFRNCFNLAKLTIPDSVSQIGKNAFENADEIQELVIGESVQNIQTIITKTTGLQKITNHSNKTYKLNTCKGKKTWYVDKKKVTKLKPGKTAIAKSKKYKITYKLNGAKFKGKYRTSYYYGESFHLPSNVTKKGYSFFGWLHDRCYNRTRIWAGYSGNLTFSPRFISLSLKNVKGKKMKITVINPESKNKNYNPFYDEFCIRYSENKDMTNSEYVYGHPNKKTLKYENIISDLEIGKTYYVEICSLERLEDFEYDDFELHADLANHNEYWFAKHKVTITK